MLFLISLSHTPKENHKPRCHKTIFLIYTNKQSDHNKYFFDDFFSSFCFFATDDLALIWVCTSSCSWAKKAVDDEDTFPFLSCNLKKLKWKTKYKLNKIYIHTHKLGLIFAANFPAVMLLSTFDLSLYLSQIYVQHECSECLYSMCNPPPSLQQVHDVLSGRHANCLYASHHLDLLLYTTLFQWAHESER